MILLIRTVFAGILYFGHDILLRQFFRRIADIKILTEVNNGRKQKS